MKDSGIATLDAVKDGDGEGIVHHWRYDFIPYFPYLR